MTALVDTRTYGKLKNFRGEHSDWVIWSFVARSHFTLIDQRYDVLLDAVATETEDNIVMSALGPEAQTLARTLYHVLVSSCEGRALLVIRASEKGNGFHAWKRLLDEYQPSAGGRFTAILMALLHPSWDDVTTGDFMAELMKWELELKRHEQESGDTVSGMMKVAVITRSAPREIKQLLRQTANSIDGDYERLKRTVREYAVSGTDYTDKGDPKTMGGEKRQRDSDAMDVGALTWGKGSGKERKGKNPWSKGGKGGKGKDGKGKGKRFYGGYSKGSKDGKKGNGGGQPHAQTKGKGDSSKWFEGYCG